MADTSLINLYEGLRRDARRFGSLRLRWVHRRARRTLAADPSDQPKQLRVVALEQELAARGLLQARSLPQRPGTRRRVPPSLLSRFLRLR